MPAKRGWAFDGHANRYRDSTSGRFVPQKIVTDLRDRFVSIRTANVQSLAADVAAGQLSVRAWEMAMRTEIRLTLGAGYVFGRGGFGQMTQRDYGRLGPVAKAQYRYLHGFAEAVAAGKLSAAQIAARAAMYVDAGVQAFERGKAAGFDVQLPAMPADGSSECLTADRCAWRLDRREDGAVLATWTGRLDERTCATCRDRIAQWSPLVLLPTNGLPAAA